ncbi:MAG: MFS transporter [Alphaproteobacteria bacterium]
MSIARAAAPAVAPVVVLVCGGLILSLNLGVRQSFGLFIEPWNDSLGWGVASFSLAIALQNLLWGVFQPVFGALADRYGTARTVILGALLYFAGLLIMAMPGWEIVFHVGAGLIIGMGLSGTAFAVVLGAIGRAYPPEKRSMALGLGSAMGSFGQFAIAPTGQALIDALGWSNALLIYAAAVLVMIPCALALIGKPQHDGAADAPQQTLRAALREASGHSGYWLLTAGFFVCGFHVAFIATHLPGYVEVSGLDPQVAAWALGLVGLFNILGTLTAGALGGRYRKKYLLSLLYGTRAVVILGFLLVPPSTVSVLVFAAAIGFLWLSTVPLTTGLVAQLFGPRYISTLFGIVFLSHQVGAFIGVWLGGLLFERTGSYDTVWWIAVALGVAAALIHLPMGDAPVERLRRQPAAA